ncbi:MAG: DUF3859 domain-containing protein, partial [Coleofasciculaceae cyanobacterium]
MKKPREQDRLAQIVAEVERLARHREEELDYEQVQQILSELNLPADLLKEAMVQLQRRQTVAIIQKRNRWLGLAIAVALVGTIATTSSISYKRQQTLAQISASQSRLTLAQ